MIESLSEIFDKNYIITDNYYIAHEYTNRAAIWRRIRSIYNLLLIYDKQMNLLHEENFEEAYVCMMLVTVMV